MKEASIHIVFIMITLIQVLPTSVLSFTPLSSLSSSSVEGVVQLRVRRIFSSSLSPSIVSYDSFFSITKTFTKKFMSSNNNNSYDIDDDDDDDNDDEYEKNNNNNKDYSFLQDLQNAKQSKLGTDILPLTSSQIQESAENSENDFLNAMKEAKAEFKKSEDELGVDGAIDQLKEGWDEEDQQWEEEKERMKDGLKEGFF